ncbi:MAG: hypothetical protein MO852_17670, partial [Candidatus Devosia euplotis]|nr:hypothetical protein [Candidatus Devosia euplotis]
MAGPLVKADDLALERADPEKDLEVAPGRAVARWAKGEATLQELKGYTPEELFAISSQGYTLFLNGKVRDAQIIFEG